MLPVVGVVSKDDIAGGSVYTVPAAGSLLVGKRLRILGVLFALFLLIALIATTLSTRQARHAAAYLEIVGHIQMHDQRLAKASQQAAQGNLLSFVQLQDSRDRINSFVKILTQGGKYRGSNLPPISDEPEVFLEKYVKEWYIEEQHISLILDNKASLKSLGNAVNVINVTNNQIFELIEKLIAGMERFESLSNEIAATEALKIVTQSFVKNANALLTNGALIPDLVSQIENDREGVRTIIDAFAQLKYLFHQNKRLNQ